MSHPSISLNVPKLRSKALASGINRHQGNGENGFSDYNHPVSKNSEFNYSCDSSNTFYPLNASMVETNSTDDLNKLFTGSSNTMYKSADYNVIKVEVDTTNTDNEQALNVFYSSDGVFKNAVRKYRTIVPSNYHFYRNFPVENDFFNMSIENLANVDEILPSNVGGRVTLSKYTQYNAPAQTQDLIDRYYFTDAVRNTNNFDDDVVLSTNQDGSFKRLADVKPVSVLGITSSITNTTMFNWNEPSSFSMTSNTFTDMNLISDNVSDLNARFEINGTGLNGQKLKETIVCSGTSNTLGLLQYNFIDTIDYLDGGSGEANVGNIRINRATNGETMCFSQASSGRSTSLLHVMDKNESGVLKTLSLTGRSGLLQKSKYELYQISRQTDGSFKKRLIFNYYVSDGEVNNTFPLNIQLNEFDRLIGLIRSDQTGSLLTGDSQFNSKVDVTIYNDKPESVRRSKIV